MIIYVRNSVRLAIRKIMYAPSKQGEQPSVEVSKEFMMSPNKLYLESSLDKVCDTRRMVNWSFQCFFFIIFVCAGVIPSW